MNLQIICWVQIGMLTVMMLMVQTHKFLKQSKRDISRCELFNVQNVQGNQEHHQGISYQKKYFIREEITMIFFYKNDRTTKKSL